MQEPEQGEPQGQAAEFSIVETAEAPTRLPPRLITVIADKDNLFKIQGQKIPVITMKASEVVHLRIIANKSTEWDKDGTVHTFTINALKDQGWDLRLKEGTQDFTLVAPAEPGQYVVECTIKCGAGHDDMKMRLVVTP